MLAEAALAGGRLTESALLFEKVAPMVEEFRVNTKRQVELRRRLPMGAVQVAEANNNWPTMQKLSEQLLHIEPNNAAALDKLGRATIQAGQGQRGLSAIAESGRRGSQAAAGRVSHGNHVHRQGTRGKVDRQSP